MGKEFVRKWGFPDGHYLAIRKINFIFAYMEEISKKAFILILV